MRALPATAGLAAMLAVAGVVAGCGGPRSDGADLKRLDPFAAVIEATNKYPLVALGEFHLMQEWHDFMGALLRRPAFTDKVDDVVVEFGNARYQDVADRFVLELEPVTFRELSQIWRNQGHVLWDAPVYERFFRNVHEVNTRLPREQRMRVLLGGADVDFSKIRSAADTEELEKVNVGDAFYADVVEREVMAKRRRAVLIAGADHLRRHVHSNLGRQDPNTATRIARRHPGKLFIVYPLPYFDQDGENLGHEAEKALESWPRPSLARLDGTWLGAQRVPHRAFDPTSTFETQVDAVIWFGPETSLTASRADPAIYRSGAYAAELQRRSKILSEFSGDTIDYIAEGLQLSTAGPRLVGGAGTERPEGSAWSRVGQGILGPARSALLLE